MARPPKAQALRKLDGNAAKKSKLEQELFNVTIVGTDIPLPSAPAHLAPEVQTIWDEVVVRLGWLDNTDYDLMETLCEQIHNHRFASRMIHQSINNIRSNGMDDYRIIDAGKNKEWFRLQKSSASEIRAILVQMGATQTSRSSILINTAKKARKKDANDPIDITDFISE